MHQMHLTLSDFDIFSERSMVRIRPHSYLYRMTWNGPKITRPWEKRRICFSKVCFNFIHLSLRAQWFLLVLLGLLVLGNFQCPQLSFVLVNTGCGNGADWSCVGRDLAILAACNHTIQSRGSFGQWAAYLSGGDSYTEYGPMMSRKLCTLNNNLTKNLVTREGLWPVII